MAHRASTWAFQRFLSSSAVRTSLQDCHPALDLSFSTVRRQVVFGRPLFLLPSGVHVRAVTQSLSGCCLRMCPMNLHLLLLCFRRLGCPPLCIQGSHVPVSYPQLCFWVHYWRPRFQSFHVAFTLERHVVCHSAPKIR